MWNVSEVYRPLYIYVLAILCSHQAQKNKYEYISLHIFRYFRMSDRKGIKKNRHQNGYFHFFTFFFSHRIAEANGSIKKEHDRNLQRWKSLTRAKYANWMIISHNFFYIYIFGKEEAEWMEENELPLYCYWCLWRECYYCFIEWGNWILG